MAKKDKKSKETEEELDDDIEDTGSSPKKKKGGCLFTLIFFILIIATLVAILGFNAGGIRDKYLRSTLEKIPVVKNLLPPIKEENLEEEQEAISVEQETINSLTSEIENLNAEITRLKEFENNQLQFKSEKEEFDRLIALNDPKAYSNFYASIYPETAAELYKEAVVKENQDKKFKDYISTFENMKKDSSSKILEELILTDMDLVITILENLSSTKRSEILSTMEAKNAASITKLLSPDTEDNQ